MGEYVTTHNKAFAACKFEGDMALRVARGIDDAQAGNDLVTSLQHSDFFLDRSIIAARAGDEPCAFRREPAPCIFAGPKIPFRACDEKRGIRNHQFVEFIDGAPKMIRMTVSEDHFRDLPLGDSPTACLRWA